jgi:hypothetical protein
LSEKEKQNIDFSRPDKLNVLSDLLALTDQARQDCVSKRWKYTRKSGESVILMDLFAKVVKWIELFKQVGDAAIQYDPVHAALPWAGVRFLLQVCILGEIGRRRLRPIKVAVNNITTFAFVTESATKMAEIICRCALFEDVCIQSASTTGSELQRSILQLYVSILRYLAKVKRYYDEHSASEFVLLKVTCAFTDPHRAIHEKRLIPPFRS